MLKSLYKNLSNVPGWRTNRRIVVIESDDWGSIRMPSVATFEALKQLGLDVTSGDALRYNANDTLANEDDLSLLFETLNRSSDYRGNKAVFTAVSVVANPDFEKIRASRFTEYHYEPFTVTLRRYPNRVGSFDLWKQGISSRLFVPQFHGREHLNVLAWMSALRDNDHETHLGFTHNFWGFNNRGPVMYQAAFDLIHSDQVSDLQSILSDGLQLFEDIFGYKATFFVPPNGPFPNSLGKIAAAHGVKFLSSSKIQREPTGEGKFRYSFHYLGQRTKHNQLLITRNCTFEPSQYKDKLAITKCLADIEAAFRFGKPAVISSHRVNYIGAIHEENRVKGLLELKILLETILKRWPDAEFMTSDELGEEILNSRKL